MCTSLCSLKIRTHFAVLIIVKRHWNLKHERLVQQNRSEEEPAWSVMCKLATSYLLAVMQRHDSYKRALLCVSWATDTSPDLVPDPSSLCVHVCVRACGCPSCLPIKPRQLLLQDMISGLVSSLRHCAEEKGHVSLSFLLIPKSLHTIVTIFVGKTVLSCC